MGAGTREQGAGGVWEVLTNMLPLKNIPVIIIQIFIMLCNYNLHIQGKT